MIVPAQGSEALNTLCKLSVVVPVYNQEKNVAIALGRIKRVIQSTGLAYEIIVVNDGSSDGTLNALQKESESDSNIRVFTYPKNIGKGHAVKTGIANSHGNTVIFTDGDLDISPHMIAEYVKQLQDSDLVIASKSHPESRVTAPTLRKFLSRAFNVFVRIATDITLRDTQSGLKAGKGSALRAIFQIMLVKRYAFDVEFLTIASLLKLVIREMPVEINLDREFNMKDIARMFVDVLAISYRYRIKRWYQRQLQKEVATISS
jgi:glycosyltransferase involved in cell wall biosynthesis